MKCRIALLVGFALVCTRGPLEACTQPPPQPPPVWVIPGDDLGELGQEFWVIFHGYTTFGALAGQNCACGLSIPSALTGLEITGVEVIDTQAQLPLPGFLFSPNTTTAQSFNAQQPGAWASFFSDVTTPIPAGLSIDLHFRVRFGFPGSCSPGGPLIQGPVGLIQGGDFNCDGCVDIKDVCDYAGWFNGGGCGPLGAVCETVGCTFNAGPCCQEAADVNGDSSLDLADIIYLFSFLTEGGPPPMTPFCLPAAGAGQGGGLGSLADQLAAALAGALVGTDEANPDGTVTGGHLSIMSPGQVEIMGEAIRPGDANQDGAIDLADGVAYLQWFFNGVQLPAPAGSAS